MNIRRGQLDRKILDCEGVVRWSIGALILANLLFLGNKMPVPQVIAKFRTEQLMHRTMQALEQWLALHNEYPSNLGNLMADRDIRRLKPALHDAAGNRFEYIRVSPTAYILRSFGSDGVPAWMTNSHDDIVRSSPHLTLGGIRLDPQVPAANLHQSPTNTQIGTMLSFTTWPPAAADGLWSPDGAWLARLIVNTEKSERRLLMIHHSGSRILTSPHDRVEEFLWSPGDETCLIFSATGSELYPDGLFRWCPSRGDTASEDALVNLLPDAISSKRSSKIDLTSNSQNSVKPRWIIALLQPTKKSLAGESLTGKSLTGTNVLTSLPRGARGATQPLFHILAVTESDFFNRSVRGKFFDQNHLWTCPFSKGNCIKSNFSAPTNRPLVNIRLALDPATSFRGRPTHAQTIWNRLPVRGKAQNLLETWFEAVANPTISVLQPYVMFYSIILQDDVVSSTISKNNTEVKSRLESWTDQMIDKLSGSFDTPKYLNILLTGIDRRSLKYQGNTLIHIFEILDADYNSETVETPSDEKKR